MKDLSPQTFGGLWQFLLKSLTGSAGKGLNMRYDLNTQPRDREALLRTSEPFDNAVHLSALPGGAYIVGFTPQAYNWTPDAGELREIRIAEMLVSLGDAQGKKIKNQGYFEGVHANGQEALVDKRIILSGIRYGIKNGLISPTQVAAFNIFPASLTREFVLDIKMNLSGHNMPASSVLFEILEHNTEITQDMHDAVDLAVKLGFPLALDDVDLRIPFDRERVYEFANRCQIVKLRREVIRDFRNGNYPDLPAHLDMLIGKNDVLVLAEGVPFQSQDQVSGLPVSATQSMHDKKQPKVA